MIHSMYYTECSLNIVFFSKNFSIFSTSPSWALDCYWLYRKWPANKSNCTVLYTDELLTIFNEHRVDAERLIQWWFLNKYLIQVITNDKRTNGQTDGQAFSMNWLAEKEIPKCCYIFAKSDFIFAKKLQTWFAKKNNGLQRNI